MHRLLLTVISVMVCYGLGFAQAVKSPDGFVVWSEGDGCDRQLMYQRLEKNKGPVEERKIAVNKAEGADIMVNISFDGKWIAFARANSSFKGRFGGCDYHLWDRFDVYIARIDGPLPAAPIKIGHGYWPTWSDDSKGVSKTLYFTKFSDQTIQKTTIGPDGSFTPPVTHGTCLKKLTGTNAHTQGSPNGKYIAYRPAGIRVQDIAANTDIPGDILSGEHPCWGPRSKYLIWSHRRVCLVKEGQVRKIGNSGLGKYHYGFSNGAEYDQGKLWAIGKIGKGGLQNTGSNTEFKEIDISNDGWKPDSTGTTVTDKGTWCDIHVEIDPASVGQNSKPGNGLAFKPFISAGANGLQLGIDAHGLEAHAAGLYNLQGIQKAFMRPAPSPIRIPLRGIADGMYVIKLSTARGGVQKAVRIAR